MYPITALRTEPIRVEISKEEVLSLIKIAYTSKFRKGLEIFIKDGYLMRYECTSYHNNDWEYVPLREATDAEIEQYAFWCQIKELFEESK